jgi:hypothetical protein
MRVRDHHEQDVEKHSAHDKEVGGDFCGSQKFFPPKQQHTIARKNEQTVCKRCVVQEKAALGG